MSSDSFLYAMNAEFIEGLLKRYVAGDVGLGEDWNRFFDSIAGSSGNNSLIASMLVGYYRNNGHLHASVDPLRMVEVQPEPFVDCLDHDTSIDCIGMFGLNRTTVGDLIATARRIYCGNVGVELGAVVNVHERQWLQQRMEQERDKVPDAERKCVLRDLMEAEYFENYLQLKFPGYKRFSVEGCESFIAVLEMLVRSASVYGIDEFVIGMAHRGRLNVLTKVVGKGYAAVLYEFSGGLAYSDSLKVSGDVKYHLGWSCDRQSSDGKMVHVSLCCNPSHLEAVYPVLNGRVRIKQELRGDRSSCLGIAVHGDAAVAGQGVVSEVLNMSKLNGYSVDGMLHIITNNQVGFTTNPDCARSGRYCSDVFKATGIPIFHVNGDDVESVLFVTKLALEYRQKFRNDVVIDIVCYRRYGHNEGDEPRFTQPLMYKVVDHHPTVVDIYSKFLEKNNIVTNTEFADMKIAFRSELDSQYELAKNLKPSDGDWFKGRLWNDMIRPVPGSDCGYFDVETGVDIKKIEQLIRSAVVVPNDFVVNDRVLKMVQERIDTVLRGKDIAWNTAEFLAFASLVSEGINIRLSGQDVGRGTFSQRHFRFVDANTGATCCPLDGLCEGIRCDIVDSCLSEYGVMGFEYGYSLDDPNRLVMWEGQFGDFVNGAQIVIDQFLSSAESKWLRCSGLVLLLPHGYEGNGPEHTSARLERFLQLCAEDNMQVVNCSTPANYFHVLRRQVKRNFRKPLIIITPKSLLRSKDAVSKVSDFSGKFVPVIADECSNLDVRKVIMCSGKLYYDLLLARKKSGQMDIAIVRLEQFYPFPGKCLSDVINLYPKSAQFVWVQEEPINMGAWFFIHNLIEDSCGIEVSCIARQASASPSCGSAVVHQMEQDALVNDALA